MEDSNILLYTSITDDYDSPRNDILVVDEYREFVEPRMNAKIYKVLPHLFFDVDYSIWIDGYMRLKVSKEELVGLLGDKDIAVLKHPIIDCIYAEADRCLAIAKNHIRPNVQPLLNQVARYREEDYPERAGMASGGMIVRKHTQTINQLNEKWWAEICAGSFRDQISFPYVFRDHVQYVDGGGCWRDNKYWKLDRNGNHLGVRRFFNSLPEPEVYKLKLL